MSRRTQFTTTALLVVFGVFGSIARGAEPKNELLEETKKNMQLRAQKLEVQVNEALADAEKIAKTDPEKAVQSLRRMLVAVSDDLNIDRAKREALMRSLREKVQKYENEGRKTPDEPKPVNRDDERKREEARVQAEIEAINSARKSKNSAEADRRLNDLAKRHPDNPAVIAQAKIGGIKDRLDEYKKIKEEREAAITKVTGAPDKVLIPKGDIEFPSNWKELSAKRTEHKISDKEKKILEALRTPLTVNFEKAQLQEAIKYLSDKLNVPIVLDQATLTAVGAAYDTPVTVQANQVTLRTILRKVLGEANLTYIIRNESIEVVTPDVARNTMVARTYSIGDLVVPVGMGMNLFQTQNQAVQNVQALIQLITTTVEPPSWEINGMGGQGTIAFWGPSMALIVKQSAELHMVLGSSLK